MKRLSTLNLLYPPFIHRLVKGVKAAQAAGIPLHVFESFRTIERQASLYEQGRTKPGNIVTRARGGRSWHNYGIAADLVLVIDGKWSWDHHDLYVKGAPYLEAQGIHWAGRDKKAFELCHYQLPFDESIYEVEELYKKGGLVGVWSKFNSRYGDKEIWKN